MDPGSSKESSESSEVQDRRKPGGADTNLQWWAHARNGDRVSVHLRFGIPSSTLIVYVPHPNVNANPTPPRGCTFNVQPFPILTLEAQPNETLPRTEPTCLVAYQPNWTGRRDSTTAGLGCAGLSRTRTL